MRKLELVGLDSDGRYLVFADEAGDEYVTPADDRLRAALRGDRARLGQLEIDMDSALRPRDIQARIRAGESPAAVAVVAQVSLDKIMPYCVPVLAERRHIADLARRHHVRRKNAEGPARPLDVVVSDRLRGRGIDPGDTEWDAWRRDDGRWSVRATYQSGEREHRADFVFDSVGRYTLADDDEAKWLTGEQQSTRKGPQPREGGGRSGERRLSSVRTGDDLLSLSGDGSGAGHAGPGADIDIATDDDLPDDDLTDDLTAVVRAVQEPEFEEVPRVLRAEPAVPADGSDRDETDESEESDETEASDETDTAGRADEVDQADDTDQQDDADEADEPQRTADEDRAGDEVPVEIRPSAPIAAQVPAEAAVEPTRDRPRRNARRAAVPSWDEIMLGRRKDEGS